MSTTPKSAPRPPGQLLTLPNGNKVLVSSAKDIHRQRREDPNSDGPQAEVEHVVHGSAEHMGHLQQLREHFESRRAQLRERPDPTFDECEHVVQQLNSVTRDLERLSTRTSGLDVNLGKFGFNANLRTYDKGGTSAEPSGEPNAENVAVEVQGRSNRQPSTIRLFKKPVVRQWFHQNLLWRTSEPTEIMAVELFFDLLYVGIIHSNGEHMSEEPNGHELLRFSITFIMSWKIWTDITSALNWFETDDLLTRLEILFAIACLLAFTTNMTNSFAEDESQDTYTQLVSFYLAVRLLFAAHYALIAYLLPMIRGVMVCLAISAVVPSALWIASIHVEMPSRLGLTWVALLLDIYGQGVFFGLFRYSLKTGDESKLIKRLNRCFEFIPAISIEHRVERMNAFVSLILGYSVVGILFQSKGGYSVNAFLGKAVLGLVQAFTFNWIYFDIDAGNINQHAIRRSANAATLWGIVHLPFVMAYIISTSALSTLVLATDVPATDSERLASPYHERAEAHIGDGVRFFYCHGLAITHLCMGVISLCHDHIAPGDIRLAKRYRLFNRVAVSIVMFFLPLAHSLRSLDLISITTGLTAWVLIVELWGMSSRDEPFIKFGEKKGPPVCSGPAAEPEVPG